MKKLITFFLLFISFQFLGAQEVSSFQAGEWLRFKLSYSGWVKAGNATLEISEGTYQERPVYKVIGKGWTTGAIKWFFNVKDHYESHFDKVTGQPYKFVRNIDEGGYTKNRIVNFDYLRNKALINDLKENTKSTIDIDPNIKDLVSAYYYLRDRYDTESIQEGDVLELNIFFDSEVFLFKLKYLGRDTINTKFGKIKCIKFRPYVMAGRVFKEEESLTLWVTADKNKVPMRIKADLRVGSLRADLEAQKGLKHPFEIQL
ncbi:MAG: DUF3108 domain-containing protein [Flavobacteriaceae bacterium]|nr:DUF3108 domain-containing protein [Flavobacteriaceae bacterium]